tara:strand:+ start:159 stop:395 length:237 start_codon:yes stop_codon:yes gene_type:complete
MEYILRVNKAQIDFIIEECKTSLEFGDWFHPFTSDEGVDKLSSSDTTYLVDLTKLLHSSVTLKEKVQNDGIATWNNVV